MDCSQTGVFGSCCHRPGEATRSLSFKKKILQRWHQHLVKRNRSSALIFRFWTLVSYSGTNTHALQSATAVNYLRLWFVHSKLLLQLLQTQIAWHDSMLRHDSNLWLLVSVSIIACIMDVATIMSSWQLFSLLQTRVFPHKKHRNRS